MIKYKERNYDLFGQPFQQIVNKERKTGRLTFVPITVNGITYVPNPVVAGTGSRPAIIEAEDRLQELLAMFTTTEDAAVLEPIAATE